MRKFILAGLAAAMPLAAIADDAAKDTVEARQGYYKLLGANMDVLASMAKGAVEYDADTARAAADNIVLMTGYNMAHLYAPGTSADDVDGARALPKIWDDFAGVQAKGGDLAEAAKAMQMVAGSGKAEMAGALGALGGSCKACHKAYRAR